MYSSSKYGTRFSNKIASWNKFSLAILLFVRIAQKIVDTYGIL